MSLSKSHLHVGFALKKLIISVNDMNISVFLLLKNVFVLGWREDAS